MIINSHDAKEFEIDSLEFFKKDNNNLFKKNIRKYFSHK